MRLPDMVKLLSKGRTGVVDDWMCNALERLKKDTDTTDEDGLSTVVLAPNEPEDKVFDI